MCNMSRTSDKLKWLLVDLDDTVARNSGHPRFILEQPVKGAREALERLTDKGYKITIFTARAWSDYEEIELWLLQHKIPFRRIICGKPLGHRLIDDRAIGFKDNWEDIVNEL